MGGISLIIYNSKNPPINIEFTKAFMNMKHRGPDDTIFITESTIPLTRLNQDAVKMNLSKRQIAEYTPYTFMLGYHRTCINDTTRDGSQPFEDPIAHKVRQFPELRHRPRRMLVCNGEIYNYESLKEQESFGERDLQSESDTEIILPMYIKYGLEETLRQLRGDFSFVLTENINTFDLSKLNVFVVRDILGTRPMYMIRNTSKNPNDLFYMFVSELKGIPQFLLNDKRYVIQQVPPGTYWSFQNSVIKNRGVVEGQESEFIEYSSLDFYSNADNCYINTASPDVISNIYKMIKCKLTECVVNRFTLSHVPVGILLSGGFDSAIILSILVHYLYSNNHDFVKNPIHAFTIGKYNHGEGECNNADVASAISCVEFLERKFSIDIHHHIVSVDDINDISDEIDNIINVLETYDPVTIQSSLPYSLLFKYIRANTDVKVLLTGEGLDEICGYPSLYEGDDYQFQKRSVELVKNMCDFDLLRCDKIACCYNLELRHPYLDNLFLEYMLSIHPKLKRPQIYEYGSPPIEKYIVRKSFNVDANDNFLESNILWRTLDDVINCFDSIPETLHNYYETMYSDSDLGNYINSLSKTNLQLGKCNRTVPQTKEQMHYRKIFERLFPNCSHLVKKFYTRSF